LAVAPILQSIYPRLVEATTNENRPVLADTYHKGAQLVSVTTAPMMLLLAVFPRGVVYAWSGDSHLAAQTAPLLVPLAVGTFLNGLMWMPYQSQLAHGWTGLTIRVNAVAVLILVPAILWLVPRHGALAAGWIWVTLNLAYVVIAIQFMHRRILLGEKSEWYLADIAAPVGGAAIIALLLTPFAPSPAEHRLLWTVFLGVVGIVTLTTALSLSNSLRPRALLLLRRLAHTGAV
jgi:O-antigen/teichoic acid export membrane protein